MGVSDISPDQVVVWRSGFVVLNATIVWTWAVMLLLGVVSWLAARRLSTGPKVSRWQALLEILVLGIQKQIKAITPEEPSRYLAFIGTLFLFILTANVLSVVPGFDSPTGSLSTTTALSICAFVAVPFYGIRSQGVREYLKKYMRPTPLMLPFNILGELSRSLALAVRLFGNMMSGAKIAAILLMIVPFLFPVVLQLLGLVTGIIQAYIFSILALVYIASASQIQQAGTEKP